MDKITLEEAYKRLKNIKLPSAYNSVAHNKTVDDELRLEKKVFLIEAIQAAEYVSGIAGLRNQLKSNQIYFDYYNTSNSNIYYKEDISKADREHIKEQFKLYKSNKEYLEAAIEADAKVTWVELR